MPTRCVSTTRSKTFIITIGLLLLSFCALSPGGWAAFPLSVNSPFTDAETPVETPTETPVVVPTNTPIPTNTPTPTESAVVVPTNTPTPTETAVVVPTNTPTPTESAVVVPTNTPTPTETSVVVPTNTPTPTETSVVVPTNTPTPTETAVVVPTNTPTQVPTNTPTPTETAVVVPTNTPTPTETAVVVPTSTPTPQPTPTSTPKPIVTPEVPDDFENPNQGITVLDGFGGLHEVGDLNRLIDLNGDGKVTAMERIPLFPYLSGVDAYRNVEIYKENNAIKAVLALRGDGKIYSAEIASDGSVNRGYLPGLGVTFPSYDDVADIEFTDNGQGYFVLLADGTLISVDRAGVQLFERIKTPKVGVGAGAIDKRQNPAVDLVIVSAETSTDMPVGYVLDARGFIHEIGGAVPLTVVGAGLSKSPIYVAMEMVPDSNQAVIADGFGRFYQAVPAGVEPMDIVLPKLGFGRAEQVLVDFEIQKDPNVDYSLGIGIIAITKYGTLHTSGATDFLLTGEGLARYADLIDLPEGVYPRIDQTESGKSFINMGILFDIIRDLELYIIEN